MRIRFTIQNAIDTLIELVGVKSGLLLPEWKLIEYSGESVPPIPGESVPGIPRYNVPPIPGQSVPPF